MCGGVFGIRGIGFFVLFHADEQRDEQYLASDRCAVKTDPQYLHVPITTNPLDILD